MMMKQIIKISALLLALLLTASCNAKSATTNKKSEKQSEKKPALTEKLTEKDLTEPAEQGTDDITDTALTPDSEPAEETAETQQAVTEPVTEQEQTEPKETEPKETEPKETEPKETEPDSPVINENPCEPDIPEVTEPTYINGILIANKTYALPSTYAPGIDPEANSALNAMIAAAAQEGISLYAVSSYRSYDYQAGLYERYCNQSGKAEADRYSARPGHSEHQTGLAFDLNSLEQDFGFTAEGIWLANHCHEYGFIIRYPHDKEHITGYMYEPWHVRYLGIEIASSVYESGLCLEEYLGITSVYAD